jgi:hypothetical protein
MALKRSHPQLYVDFQRCLHWLVPVVAITKYGRMVGVSQEFWKTLVMVQEHCGRALLNADFCH